MAKDRENLAALSLFPATPSQIIESRKTSFVQWNQGRTLVEYLERDSILDSLENSSNRKLTTWVLAPREDPETLDFKCSCETYRRIAIVSKPTPGSVLRRVEEVVGYAIASVFTRSVSRRQGYASHMMRLLHWVLAPRHLLPARFPAEWGEAPTPRDWAGDAQFSILYSDVGPEFYTRCGPVIGQHSGWKVTGAVSTTWDVESCKEVTNPCTTSGIEHAWLSAGECNSLWDEDSELIRSDLQGITSGNETVFAFLPSGGLGTWSIWKSMDFKDSQHYLPSDKWGVQLRCSEKLPAESLTFATWTYDIRVPPRTLVVTRLRATEETFGPLFSKIFEAAREQNVVMIEIWNVPRQLQRLADSLGGKTSSRTGHLPSMKWYEEEVRDGLIWSFNERFAWC